MLTSSATNSGVVLVQLTTSRELRLRTHLRVFALLEVLNAEKLQSSWESADGPKTVCTLLSDYPSADLAYDAHVAAVAALLKQCPPI